jgi:DNA-binding MarR family transcriptional regulator
MDSLDLRYSKSVLLKIYEKDGGVIQSDLKGIASNWRTLTDVINSLKDDGYLVVTKRISGRRITQISLTEKGHAVAKQLKRTQEVANGEPIIQISDQEAVDWAKEFTETTKNLSLLFHVNVFEDHVTIGEEKDGKLRVINVYVRVNGHGIMRLWCEEDESFDCIHTKYAWTLPKVQEMYANNVRNGRVNGK